MVRQHCRLIVTVWIGDCHAVQQVEEPDDFFTPQPLLRAVSGPMLPDDAAQVWG
jgi:hypothetical protein